MCVNKIFKSSIELSFGQHTFDAEHSRHSVVISMWHCPCLYLCIDRFWIPIFCILCQCTCWFYIGEIFMQIYWIIFHTHTNTHSMIKKYGRESVERTEFSFVCKVDRNFNAFSYHLRLACRTLFTYSICIPEYHVETILLQCQYTIPIPMPILIFESLYLISNSHQLIWQMYNANIELDFWPFESRFVDYYEQYSSECLMDFIISVTLISKYGIYRCFFFFVFINTEIDASLHAIQSRHMCL